MSAPDAGLPVVFEPSWAPPARPPRSTAVVGWDVGGAHLKACLLVDGEVVDVAQWACPLWLGVYHLERAIDVAMIRWPRIAVAHEGFENAGADGAIDLADVTPPDAVHHAVTMTGEMTDLFENRQHGVLELAGLMSRRLGANVRFYAGQRGWCGADDVAAEWPHIASANWLATATQAARALRDGLLVDIGSTTTDLIVFRNGRVQSHSRSDADRLASGELVYQGVVRTPLCALARRIRWRDRRLNVMAELFATTADVYRLTGELKPEHDIQPSADNGSKDIAATHQRLARMVGLDAGDGTDADWLAFASAWRSAQLAELTTQANRVLAAADLPMNAPLVSAGCGDFLVRRLAQSTRRRFVDFASHAVRLSPDALPGVSAWAQVCAPSAAVAQLLDAELVAQADAAHAAHAAHGLPAADAPLPLEDGPSHWTHEDGP
jgi:(4-(4-[2-(gamma-L-glutamylamino)ethyl]phenoxymethyl)furan-2-yl)methanamine synthase